MAIAAQANSDRAGFGILLMLMAWFLFACVDTSAKWLVLATVTSVQVAFMRYAGHFVISVWQIGRGGLSRDRFATSHVWMVVIRSILLMNATFLNFVALRYLPLTVVSAIMFSAPILVCLLSWPMLGERAGPWRWFAIILGFIGVLIVIRPLGEGFHWAVLLSCHNAVALALYSILTRKLSGKVATETMQFYLGLFGTFILLPFAIWNWQSPETVTGWLLLIAIGPIAWAGHDMLTRAHGMAEANTLMPYTYSLIFYMAIFGWLVFGDIPDIWTVIGASVIILSGLIIWKRAEIREATT